MRTQRVQNAWDTQGMRTEFWGEKPSRRQHVEDQWTSNKDEAVPMIN
jgi:hypothetical protein